MYIVKLHLDAKLNGLLMFETAQVSKVAKRPPVRNNQRTLFSIMAKGPPVRNIKDSF